MTLLQQETERCTKRFTGQPGAEVFSQGLGPNFKASAGGSLITSHTPSSGLPSLRAPIHDTFYLSSFETCLSSQAPDHLMTTLFSFKS